MCDHSKWKFNHTSKSTTYKFLCLLTASVLRVKDPQKSLEYYELLGLSQINKVEQPDNKFDLYFLGQPLLSHTSSSC